MAGALRTILAKFGFDVDDKKLDAAKSKTDDFAASVKSLAEKAFGGSVGGAIQNWIGDVRDASSEFVSLARMTGTSTEEMQRWTSAAKLSGSSVEALTAGFRVLQKNASQAASGAEGGLQDVGEGAIEALMSGKKAQEIFKALGVDVKDSNGQMKSSSQLMGDVGIALSQVNSPAERATLAMQLFGRQGAQLLPMFANGEKGLQEYLDRIDDLGGGVSQEAIKALKANSRATKEYDMATLSLKSAVVSQLLPGLTKKVQLLTDVVSWMNKTQKGTHILQAGMLVLGAALLYMQREAIMAGIKTALAWLPTILLFAALALIVDDVWTAFEGGDSVIGKVLDKLLGAGASKAIFSDMGKDVDALGVKLSKLPTFSDRVGEAFVVLGATLVKFFVDDIPEAWEFFWKDMNDKAKTGGKGFIDYVISLFVDGFKWLDDWCKSIFRSIFDGLLGGLKSGWGAVRDEFGNLSKEIIEDFRKTFRIHSPSGVMFDLVFGGVLGGALKALARGTPVVRDQADETFSPLLPDSPAFAPIVRVPTYSQAGGPTGPSTKRVDQRNEFKIQINGGGNGVRDAARDGVGLAFDDERRAMLAALEDLI